MTATIIITRPKQAGLRLANALVGQVSQSCDIILSPVIDIVPVAAQMQTTTYSGCIFTSEQGVRHGLSYGPPRQCWCVGNHTADMARAAGLTVLGNAQNANGLIEQIIRAHPNGPLIHYRGVHTRGEIASRLSQSGINCDEAVVYDQVALSLNARALAALGGEMPVILPLYSPRSAGLVGQQGPFAAPVTVVAMSAAVADVAKSIDAHRLIVLKRPEGAEMRAALVKLAETT